MAGLRVAVRSGFDDDAYAKARRTPPRRLQSRARWALLGVALLAAALVAVLCLSADGLAGGLADGAGGAAPAGQTGVSQPPPPRLRAAGDGSGAARGFGGVLAFLSGSNEAAAAALESVAALRTASTDLTVKLQSLSDGLASVVRELNELEGRRDSEQQAARERMQQIQQDGEHALKELSKEVSDKVAALKKEQEGHYKEMQELIAQIQKAAPPPPQPEHRPDPWAAEAAGSHALRDHRAAAADAPPPEPDPCKDAEDVNSCRQGKIKDAFLHSWNAYKKHAWGQDELMPVSQRAKNWGKAGGALGLTMLDSISTLWVMGLTDEFDAVRRWVMEEMDVERDYGVSAFEVTIRMVGGMLSAYELSGEKHKGLIDKAKMVADKVLWAYNTSCGIPHATVNLRTHQHSNPQWTGGSSVLSEFGTVQLELRTLSYHTGDPTYDQKATWIMDLIEAKAPSDMLCPTYFNTMYSQWASDHITLGALGDSFYEYLLKQYLLTGQSEGRYREMYLRAAKGITQRLLQKSVPSGQAYLAEYKRGSLYNKMDHLACFAGGMLAYGTQQMGSNYSEDRSRHLQIAEELTETCYQMYRMQPTGIAPEMVEFRGGGDMVAGARASYYLLRPEAVESFMYLWRVTKKQQYRDWGWEVFRSIERWCKVDSGGYSGLRSVQYIPPQKDDLQQSFWLAETLKYLYMLFSPDDVVPFTDWVLNTEAHPLRIRKRQPTDLWPPPDRARREKDLATPIEDRLRRVRDEFERRQPQGGAQGREEDPYGAQRSPGAGADRFDQDRALREARERQERWHHQEEQARQEWQRRAQQQEADRRRRAAESQGYSAARQELERRRKLDDIERERIRQERLEQQAERRGR